MSTRSFIAKVTDDGYRSVYCHSDGYPDYVGRILRDHYADPAKVVALIGLGNLSRLGPEIGEKHDFNNYGMDRPDWCLAYGRDRGDAQQEAGEDATFDELATSARESNAEWLYIFAPAAGGWLCVDLRSKGLFPRPLAEMDLVPA
jgi:hypothetical protein